MRKMIHNKTLNRNYLTQPELALRLGVSENTLEKWRWKKTGPRFFKLGGVRYLVKDVEEFEAARYEASRVKEEAKKAKKAAVQNV